MPFQRSAAHAARKRQWEEFLTSHWPLYEKSGIPLSVVEDFKAWGYFLDHGDAPWLQFDVEKVSDEQAPYFVEFIANYFVESGETYSLSFHATGLDKRIRDRIRELT